MSKKHRKHTPPSSRDTNGSQMQGTRGVLISLPVPNHQVITSLKSHENSDMIIHSYLDVVKSIAELESSTVLKVAAKKYSFVWKVIAILCALVFLIVGLFLGYRISPKWGSFGFDASPAQMEKNR